MADETINRVGMGVDLLGGPDVLSNLRAIRSEMQAIAALGNTVKIPRGVGGVGAGGPDPYQPNHDKQLTLFEDLQRKKTRVVKQQLSEEVNALRIAENEKTAIVKRGIRARTRAQQPITSDEIDVGAAQKVRARNVTKEINRKIEADEKRHQEDLIRIEKEGLARRQANLEAFRSRVRDARNQENILERQELNKAERKQFRRHRNDPARDEDTNRFRSQLAAETVAIRQAARERRTFLEQQERERLQLEETQRRAFDKQRKEEIQRRSNDPRVINRNISNVGLQNLPKSLRDDIELDLEAQRVAKERLELQKIQAERIAEGERRKAANAEKKRLAEQQFAIDQRKANIDNEVAVRQVKDQRTTEKAVAGARLDRDRALPGGVGLGKIDDMIAKTNKLTDASLKYKRVVEKGFPSITGAIDIKASRDIHESLNRLGLRSIQLSKELRQPSFTRARQEIIADMNLVEKEINEQIVAWNRLELAQKKAQFTKGPFGPPLPPNVPPRGPRGAIPGREPFNEKGFFTSADALGRITRNILLYEVVSQATYGLVNYIQQSIQAAKTTVEFTNALRFATETAGGNIQANQELAESLRPVGLSRQQARAAVTEAVRFAEERPEDTAALTKIVNNIAAQRGQGIDKTDELIEQLRRRESKFYKRIFGKTVEEIYEDEAKKAVRRTPNTARLVIGGQASDFKSETDEIKSYVAAMDDAAKERAVFDFILAQGARFEGEAEERARTLAGRLDLMAAAWLDAQEAVGLFITELKPVAALIDGTAASVGLLDRLRPPELGRSGPNATITNYDIQRFGAESTTGPRAQTLDFLNNQLGNLVLGALTVGGLGLFGRRNAREQKQTGAFNQAYYQNLNKFGGDASAAASEARAFAEQQRPTIVGSVRAGLQRVTLGMTEAITRTSLMATEAANAQIPSGTRFYGTGPEQRRGFGGLARGIYTPEFLAEQDARSRLTQKSLRDPYFDLAQVTREGNKDYFAARNLQIEQKINEARASGGITGGIAGGAIGFSVGSLIADSMKVGPLVATGLTITGAIAGDIVGTSVGSAVGGAIGAKGLTAAAAGVGIGAAGLSLIAAALPIAAITQMATSTYLADRSLRTIEAQNPAFAIQAKERVEALNANRIRFRSNVAGDSLGLLTGKEVVQRINESGGRLSIKDFVEETVPAIEKLKGVIKIMREFSDRRRELFDDPDLGLDVARYQANALGAAEDNAFLNSFIGKARDESGANFAQNLQKRLQQDKAEADKIDRARQERINEQSNALGKLRDAAQGSFRIVDEISAAYGGADNPFVKVFADGATLAQRMQQQWGFLGDATVKYFTTLEQRAITLQGIRVSFGQLANQMELVNKAARERDEREAPGFSSRQLAGEEVGRTGIDLSRTIFSGRQQEAQILERFFDPLRSAKDEIVDVRGSGAIGQLFGASERQIRPLINQAIGDILQQFNPAQIANDPFLKDVALRNIRDERTSAFENFQDALKKSELQSREDARAKRDSILIERRRAEELQKAEQARRTSLKELGPKATADDRRRVEDFFKIRARDVGQEADRLLISRFEGVNPKDLTFDQFEARQAALRREVERTVAQEAEARAAVKEGLAYQKAMAANLDAIRQAIINGDVSMLIQVQNDTQARTDQKALQEANGKNYNVPLDQGGYKTNPYSRLNDVYGRGGNKR